MIQIFIESGVSKAQLANKHTTNEDNFVDVFIRHHFPTKKRGVDYEIFGLGGKDTLEESAPLFIDGIAQGHTNLVIFDADTNANGGGFAQRQSYLLGERNRLNLSFDLFLWPNNHDDGDFECLLENMINPQHARILHCFKGFESCVSGQDPQQQLYHLPGRKGEMYTYIEIMNLSPDERKKLHKGYYLFEDTRFWNLDAAAGNSLKTFLATYL